ncbi:alpha/beta fold hydrolase [Sorangium sp. So ce117]|uniref:alpha/beta fold hydrolase n=1 Tax=Sorangium sp. So ce117 TaxID=3133277 RepID=UPI003F608677
MTITETAPPLGAPGTTAAGRLGVATRAGRLAVTSAGSGPPVVLLPANGRAAADFDAIRPRLAERHRTVALDWPAMGDSPAPERPRAMSASLLADALEDALDALDVGPAILVGHSVGGFAAARLASRAPDRVRALVLVNSGGFARVGPLERLFCAVKGLPAVTGALEGRFARFHTRCPNEHTARMLARVEAARRREGYAEAVGAVWRSFARPESDLRAAARAIRCETLLVWGARDPVIPRSAAIFAQRAIPGARLAWLDTGHTPFAEAPGRFLEAVEPFLASLAALPRAA